MKKNEVVVVVVLALIATFAWTHVQGRLTEVEKINKPNFDLIRQAAWEAEHPCNNGNAIPAFSATDEFPVDFPVKNSEWCTARTTKQKKVQAKLDSESLTMPVNDMIDCAYTYDGNVRTIDRVDSPNVHNSWVLGGSCEKLAQRLQNLDLESEVWNRTVMPEDDPRLNGLCVTFTDDNPLEAYKCQTEMRHWLEVYCLNAMEDRSLRKCLRIHLETPTVEDDIFRPLSR